MSDDLYALSEDDVKVLREVVAAWKNGTLNRPLQHSRRSLSVRRDIIFGVPDAAINGTSDALSDPPSGTLNVYEMTSAGATTDSGQDETIYNPSSVARTTGEYVVAVRDYKSGLFMAATGSGGTSHYKHLCRFTLDAALATSDPSALALLTNQYGEGTAHSTGEITVANMLVSGGTYLFEGTSGMAGLAYYTSGAGTTDTNWEILQLYKYCS